MHKRVARRLQVLKCFPELRVLFKRMPSKKLEQAVELLLYRRLAQPIATAVDPFPKWLRHRAFEGDRIKNMRDKDFKARGCQNHRRPYVSDRLASRRNTSH